MTPHSCIPIRRSTAHSCLTPSTGKAWHACPSPTALAVPSLTRRNSPGSARTRSTATISWAVVPSSLHAIRSPRRGANPGMRATSTLTASTPSPVGHSERTKRTSRPAARPASIPMTINAAAHRRLVGRYSRQAIAMPKPKTLPATISSAPRMATTARAAPPKVETHERSVPTSRQPLVACLGRMRCDASSGETPNRPARRFRLP